MAKGKEVDPYNFGVRMGAFVYGNIELGESRIEVRKICGESSIEDGEDWEKPTHDV